MIMFKDLHWPLKVAVVGAWVYIIAAVLAVLINFVVD